MPFLALFSITPTCAGRDSFGVYGKREYLFTMANGRFAMARGIGLHKDFDAATLRRLARKSKDSGQGRRLLALAEIYDGGSRSEAALPGGVTL
jgi:hypothetical protein